MGLRRIWRTYALVPPSPPSLRDTSPQAGEELCPSNLEGELGEVPSSGSPVIGGGQPLTKGSSLVKFPLLAPMLSGDRNP